MEPLADRLLDALGDPIARRTVRLLLNHDLTQAELIGTLGVAQPTVSRVVKLLRAIGLVEPEAGGRGQRFVVASKTEAIALFLATDRLAERLLDEEGRAQRERSRETRLTTIKPASEDACAGPT
jgi:DNA-binding MarR family transcriptional regulator